MAPSGRGRRRRKSSQRRWYPPCRKKTKKPAEDPKETMKKMKKTASEQKGDSPPSGCCTPKDERFRIPECTSCPPAPMKRRPAASGDVHYPQRRSISYFAPPDLELFFMLAFPEASL